MTRPAAALAWWGLLLCAVACGGAPTTPTSQPEATVVEFTTDFRLGFQGWQSDQAYVAACTGPAMAFFELRPFGPPNEADGSGIYAETRCQFVFAFLRKRMSGVAPERTYRATFNVEIETDTPPTMCYPVDIHQEWATRDATGTFVYAAAVTGEPTTVVERTGIALSEGLLRSGFLGDIGTSVKRCDGQAAPLPIWEFRTLQGGGMTVVSDANGQVWLMLGFSAPIRGRVYFSRFAATLTPEADARLQGGGR